MWDGVCLRIAKATPVFKVGNNTELSNYRPILTVPRYFPKHLSALCTIAYTNTYLIQEFSLKKQFGFQEGHATNHAVLQLVDQINNNFKQNSFTLEMFVDLSKAFDTVDHNILLKKLEINRIVGKNLKWFKNYLNNRKQYIQINNKEKTNLLLVK